MALTLTKTFVLMITILLVLLSSISGHQFTVGGPEHWTVPAGNQSFYIIWAMNNRFHVSDFLYFEYERDSVLVVDFDHYDRCNTTDPFSVFTDGKTLLMLDRPGLFYFISGEADHCIAGQRMIIKVMSQLIMTPASSSSIAPIISPAPDDMSPSVSPMISPVPGDVGAPKPTTWLVPSGQPSGDVGAPKPTTWLVPSGQPSGDVGAPQSRKSGGVRMMGFSRVLAGIGGSWVVGLLI